MMPEPAGAPESMLDHALRYAKFGIPVVPLHGIVNGSCTCAAGAACKSAGKHPRVLNWTAEATTDEAVIRGWFTRWPDSNIGGATGHAMDVFDIDGDEGVTALSEMVQFNTPLPLNAPVVRTGSGGLHYYFAPTGTRNSASKIGTHLDWRGLGGQVVLPPSRNANGSYSWVRELDGAIPDAPSWLTAVLSADSHRIVTMDEPAFGREASEGNRNDTLFRAMASVRRAGADEDTLMATAITYNADKINPPLTESEVRTIVGSVMRYEAGTGRIDAPEPPPETGIKRWQINDLLYASLPEQEWLIEAFLPAEGLVAVIGSEKSGKSTLMLQMALCLATGTSFMGMETAQTPVLFIEEEGNERGLQFRARRQTETLHLTITPGTPLFMFQRQRFRLDDPAWLRELEQQIDLVGAKAVLMGPLAQLAAIDNENDSAQMNAVMRTLVDLSTKKRVVIVLAHHRRKESAKEPPNTVGQFFQTARGSSALMGAVDTGIGVRRELEEPHGTMFVLQRAAAASKQAIRYVDGDINTLTFEIDPDVAQQVGMTKALRLTLDAIESLAPRKVTLEEVALARAEKVSRDTLLRHADTLFIGGLINRESQGERKPILVSAKPAPTPTQAARQWWEEVEGE